MVNRETSLLTPSHLTIHFSQFFIGSMLDIKDLHATVGDKEILKGITLTVKPGEVHAVMGPNGSGKSTLAQVLAGHPAYEVTGGSVTYDGEDLLEMDAEVRAQQGIF